MQRTITTFTLSLVLVSVAICTNGQQKAPDEFVSVIGQFGVMLPSSIRDDFKYDIIRLGDDKLVSWIYRWDLDSDQAAIIYAIANVDMEAKTDLYLERFRDAYAPGSVINQKKTSFSGHPGLVSIVDSPALGGKVSRAMIWTYLFKNRVYLMSLTLDDNAKIEEHVKLMSTFRLLSLRDVEMWAAARVKELTPERLPLDPHPSRPTTDAQDAALKGPVKSVITESEPFVDDSLFGVRELVSVENYDEHGNLIRIVEYRNSRPVRVRFYGVHEGQRAFRETRRTWPISRDKGVYVAREPRNEEKLYTIKYKHDAGGRLVEMHVLGDDGKEAETAKYNLKAKTVARRYDPEFRYVQAPRLEFKNFLQLLMESSANASSKENEIVSTLDSDGKSIEDAYQVPNGMFSRPGFDGEQRYRIYRTDKVRHEYDSDVHGNWIKRKSFALTQDKKSVPMEVTYRTISYYE